MDFDENTYAHMQLHKNCITVNVVMLTICISIYENCHTEALTIL